MTELTETFPTTVRRLAWRERNRDRAEPRPSVHADASDLTAGLPPRPRDRAADRRWLATTRLAAMGGHGRQQPGPSCRQRLEALLDSDSFVELGLFRRGSGRGLTSRREYTDGVVAGFGTVDGRQVFVFVQDREIFGGSQGLVFSDKVCETLRLATAAGSPVVGIFDGGGARLHEGPMALAGYGNVFRRHVRASGVIPQISIVLGPCAGGAAYAPALTDFVLMERDRSRMFVTGPRVVARATGEIVDEASFGGAVSHATQSGVCHLLCDDEAGCFDGARGLLQHLPSNNQELAPRFATTDRPDRRSERAAAAVPASSTSAYDVHEVIDDVLDTDGPLLESAPDWAPNLVCGFGRIDGRPVGIVANQPAFLAGALNIAASEKGARFVRTCDAFNVPIVTLVDVPGFLPSSEQEVRGIIRHGAKLVYAYCEATVPRISVILRKAVGGAYIVMDSKSIGADLSFAWPSNEVLIMAPEHAVEIVHRREIAGTAACRLDAAREGLVERYRDSLVHPLLAASEGLIDDVIDPGMTRPMVVRGLAMLETKREEQVPRKHGNGPL